MDRLTTIIHEYDTFSGADITQTEADKIAKLLFARLCKVVEEGGTLRCDGDVLAGLLDEVRDDNVTAGDVAGTPELYNLAWYIGCGRVTWECTGTNRDMTKVRFARLVNGDGGLRQITCYVGPDQVVRKTED